MKLLGVKTVFDWEAESKYDVLKELDDKAADYAILSHHWCTNVGYGEITGLMKMEEQKRDEVRYCDGYQKIIKNCEQASKDSYKWVWIDTSCIDKWSSVDLLHFLLS